jgi:putative membrane protein
MRWISESKWHIWSRASSASSPTPRTLSEREPGVEDATRRTRLANERTYLAWWRTGLTSIALGIGIGRLFPPRGHAAHWAFELVGAAFGFLGVALVWAGFVRLRTVEDALDRGSFAPLDVRLAVLLLVAGVVLGLAVVALVLFG